MRRTPQESEISRPVKLQCNRMRGELGAKLGLVSGDSTVRAPTVLEEQEAARGLAHPSHFARIPFSSHPVISSVEDDA